MIGRIERKHRWRAARNLAAVASNHGSLDKSVGSQDNFLTFIFALCSGITLLTKLCFKGSKMLGTSALWCDSSNSKIPVPTVHPTGF